MNTVAQKIVVKATETAPEPFVFSIDRTSPATLNTVFALRRNAKVNVKYIGDQLYSVTLKQNT